jgi:hypothetical protein
MDRKELELRLGTPQFEENCSGFIKHFTADLLSKYPLISFESKDWTKEFPKFLQKEIDSMKKDRENPYTIRTFRWMLNEVDVTSASENIAVVRIQGLVPFTDKKMVEAVHKDLVKIASNWYGYEEIPSELVSILYNFGEQLQTLERLYFFIFE